MGGQYLHVPFNEGFCHSEHVSVLNQFKQVLPQLLLILGDFSQLNLQLLQLLLKRKGGYSRGQVHSEESSQNFFIVH